MSRAAAVAFTAAVLAAALSSCGSAARSGTVTRTVTTNAPPTQSTQTAASSGQCGSANCATTAQEAAAVVRRLGYTTDASSFDPHNPLNVVIGVRTGSADGTAQNAFFFWNGRYIGTDTSDNSAG